MKKPKNKFEGWPTTRCYPRTLEEAFPQDRLGEWWIAHEREYPTWNDVTLYTLTVFVLWLVVKLLEWIL